MIIALKNLTKVFRTTEVETTALDGVEVQIREGEFVSLMGPSGCGKSTLMHILGLIDVPTHGSYEFVGRNVSGLSKSERGNLRRDHMGFIFQSFNLIDELTVFENVELPLLYGKVPRAERERRVTAALQRVDMAHRVRHHPVQLSGGQQQRVAVARAIVNSPKVILADEPTGNLDSEHGEQVMRLLQELNRDGSTIVMVTHSERDMMFGTRVIRLLDGKVVAEHDVERAAA